MNYNTLRNKPTINYRELIGDNTVSEVGGITEEEFNILINTDLSSYYTKAQIDELFARSFVYREKSGPIVTFDCPESTTSGITKVVSDIVAVQSGSGDPSPTNVRPITGWSAVNVVDTGVNVWDEEWESGLIDHTTGNKTTGNGICSKNYISVKADTNYYAHIPIWYRIAFFDANKIFISGVQLSTNIFTTPTNAKYMKLSTNALYGTTYNNDISINYPSTDTDYHAYNGQTYTTTLKDGQGNPMTCYGGELSNENGVQRLVLTHGYIASYNGETLPSTWISDRDVYAEGTTPTTGAEVVYELATPQQITQNTLSITSIAGINNIWCDSGDITVKALDRIIQG